jgi:hypothetical protein
MGFCWRRRRWTAGTGYMHKVCVRARGRTRREDGKGGVSQRRVGGDTALLAALRELDVVAEPCQALEDALACSGAAGLDLPDVVLGDLVELQLVGDFLRSHGW